MAKKKKASFFDDEGEDTSDSNIPPSSDPFPPVNPISPTDEIQSDPPPSSDVDTQAVMQNMHNMMNTFQSMMQAGALPGQWSASSPFQEVETPEAVSHDIIKPNTLERGKTVQVGLDVHPLFGKLFVDNEYNLIKGIPAGTTLTLTGPAYSGKTRAALEMILNAIQQGIKTAYVVAEEGFYDSANSGRNDLFSRFLQLAEYLSSLSEEEFRAKYDDQYIIVPHQYHLGKTWTEFIKDYRYVVEDLECKFTIIDSINALDPSKLNTVDNLNALKTYNHEKGVTCVVIGQVKDTGIPQGGEALYHTSEVSLHIFEKTMTSKAQAAEWGAEYRDSIHLISARSKVCQSIGFPIRINFDQYGLIRVSTNQPEGRDYPKGFWD